MQTCHPVRMGPHELLRYPYPINPYDQFFRIPVGGQKGKETLNRGKRASPVVVLASVQKPTFHSSESSAGRKASDMSEKKPSSRVYPDNHCHATAIRNRELRIHRPVILLEGGDTRYSDIHIPSTHQFFRSAPQKGKETLIEGGELLMWLR